MKPQTTGTLDFILAAIEELKRDGCTFILICGRPGERFTRTWSRNRGNTSPADFAALKDVFAEHMAEHYDKPDE